MSDNAYCFSIHGKNGEFRVLMPTAFREQDACLPLNRAKTSSNGSYLFTYFSALFTFTFHFQISLDLPRTGTLGRTETCNQLRHHGQ